MTQLVLIGHSSSHLLRALCERLALEGIQASISEHPIEGAETIHLEPEPDRLEETKQKLMAQAVQCAKVSPTDSLPYYRRFERKRRSR